MAGGAAPFGDLGIAKTETAMGVLIAQEFEGVGCEINEHQDPPRSQHPGGFGDRRGWPVGIVQDLMYHDRVEGRIGQFELIHVVATDTPVCQPGSFEVDPRHRQHLARLVNAESTIDPRRQDFEHSPGPGADVEQIARFGGVDDLDQRRFDLAFIDV